MFLSCLLIVPLLFLSYPRMMADELLLGLYVLTVPVRGLFPLFIGVLSCYAKIHYTRARRFKAAFTKNKPSSSTLRKASI